MSPEKIKLAIDVLAARLEAVTAARDEACEIAFDWVPSNGRHPEARAINERIAKLRKVGAK